MRRGIVAEGLLKRFGEFTAVDDVSFAAEEGKITALLGPSGSGKSTVLRMIAGLESPDEGRVWLDAEEQTTRRVQDRRFGFVFQHFALFRHMTVRDNIAFGLTVRREPATSRRQRVSELLELVRLTPWADRYPDQLSGGQRQRVALARALAPRPKVLLLDEPFGALDAHVRQELRAWLDELHRELGVTSLLVTHDQDEALELAHRIVVMHQGKVQQAGSPAEIYNQPATPFVAGFVGSANVIRGRVEAGRLVFSGYAIDGADHLANGQVAHAFIRPQYVTVANEPVDASTLPATVERATDLGWLTKLRMRLSDGQAVTAEVPNDDARGIGEGSRVYLHLRKARVFDQAAQYGSPSLPAGLLAGETTVADGA